MKAVMIKENLCYMSFLNSISESLSVSIYLNILIIKGSSTIISRWPQLSSRTFALSYEHHIENVEVENNLFKTMGIITRKKYSFLLNINI